jgi:hypothetical protein
MALKVNTLQSNLYQAFKKAQNTPPPADPSQAPQVQDQILSQLALDLSGAINTFVTGGEIVQLIVSVKDKTNTEIGTGTQTSVNTIQ